MVRISSTLQILHGRAGIPAGIDGHLITGTCCGDWDWLTPELASGQVCQGSCYLQNASGAILDAAGANWFRASQGRWAAALAGGSLRTNFGLAGQDIVPIASDVETGDLAFVQSYSSGRGILIVRKNGERFAIDVTLAFSTDHTSLKNGLISFVEEGVGPRIVDFVNGVDVPFVPAEDGPADWVIGLRMAAGVVLVERTVSQGQTRIRMADSPIGLVIPQANYNFDALAIDPHGIKVAWSRSEAENWPDIGVEDIDIATLPSSGATVSVIQPNGQVGPAPSDLASSIRTALGDSDAVAVLIVLGVVLLVVALESV